MNSIPYVDEETLVQNGWLGSETDYSIEPLQPRVLIITDEMMTLVPDYEIQMEVTQWA